MLKEIRKKMFLENKQNRVYGFMGRNQVTILGIRKSGYSDFRIRVDSVSDFEHPYNYKYIIRLYFLFIMV